MVNRLMDELIMGRWMDEWIDGQMDRWMNDGWRSTSCSHQQGWRHCSCLWPDLHGASQIKAVHLGACSYRAVWPSRQTVLHEEPEHCSSNKYVPQQLIYTLPQTTAFLHGLKRDLLLLYWYKKPKHRVRTHRRQPKAVWRIEAAAAVCFVSIRWQKCWTRNTDPVSHTNS